MGWFDEQIKQRKQSDDALMEESFTRMADAVLGSRMSMLYSGEEARAQGAIAEILKYYKIKACEVPDSVKTLEDRLEYLLRPHGIMRRNVRLERGWYKNAIGAFLGRRKDGGSVVAFLPRGLTGYVYFDVSTGKWVKLSSGNEGLFEEEAICFYKPFPLKKLTIASLARYILECFDRTDLALTVLGTAMVSLVGMLGPKINNLLFGVVVPGGELSMLLGLTVFMVSVSVSTMLLQTVNSMFSARVNTKLNLSVQAAVVMRILSLPADFFKEYSSGELLGRAENVQSLCSMLVSTVLSTGLTSLFSLIYITQIFAYAPALVVPALVIILVTVGFSLFTTFCQMRVSKQQMELSVKESGMSYALITGIQKIKLSGAEKRAFARWSDLYTKQVSLQYHPPMFLRANTAISSAISMTGMIVMYYMAARSGISVADYYAFNTAYGMVSGAFMSVAGIAITIAQFKPILEMAKPILDAVPEVSEGKQVIDRLSGAIEVSNVSFRYNENMPLVLDDISLKIRPGQYLAIVGATGCGKSTLMRILLGFEKPQKGAVYYNGKDLNTIDLKSLRRRIGVVMQNGKLFQGDIFSNITISAPQLTLDEAWEAAEMAGIAEDIRRMPMGMHTIISEGSGGISGGQRQRLMIARAIAPKPRVLMFDEATSALDNITQKTVSDSLEKLKCTRIVIAHRLSTIRQCDRIIYLEKGKIVEDGTYEELIAKGGRFADLVERQRLDV
ncbi:MAG: NHLP bacteriocin export ABC transporter permease/ATPase subunit [Oscillibacter sp.]|nr:NHLP bacteriocin export ABC transporter permease/ATPase subunit [Oscillibacter sp.]MBQ2996452.1 NHLP bacteriocin export ABC transporter permease/ATPase subunit [Oscillibacter sp.]